MTRLTSTPTLPATTNATVWRRGAQQAGGHNLRQVGLSYVLDGNNGLSPCHHLYRGNLVDAEEFPQALHRIVTLLESNQISPETVPLVLDRGSAALANTLELEQAGVGWISALPWTQAPAELRSSQQLTPLSNDTRFEEKFWDVMGLYLNPPAKTLVLCCGEKSQCQALEPTQPALPLGLPLTTTSVMGR